MAKYLVKVDYYCPAVATGGKWMTVESEKKPELGSAKQGPLPEHGCKKYYNSQLCEEDETCSWQTILEVKSLPKGDAKRVKTNQLEAACF